MEFFDEIFKQQYLNELLEKFHDYDNSKMFVEGYDTLSAMEIPNEAPEEKKQVLINLLHVLKEFYIKDNISYSKTFLNKIYFTNYLEQDRLRDHVSSDFLKAIDLTDGQLPFFPLWFSFAYPHVAKWFYEDLKEKKQFTKMFSDSITRIQMPAAEILKIMIDREQYDIFDYFQPRYSFDSLELRRLISIYNSSKNETNVNINNHSSSEIFHLLSNISMANLLSYESILNIYFKDFQTEFGDIKYNEISTKIGESNSASKLIDESVRNKIKVNSIDFTTYVPKMILLFGKPETIALASLKLLQRWDREVNKIGLMGNGKDLKSAALRILSSCGKTKLK